MPPLRGTPAIICTQINLKQEIQHDQFLPRREAASGSAWTLCA
jgi:hypothetical protein